MLQLRSLFMHCYFLLLQDAPHSIVYCTAASITACRYYWCTALLLYSIPHPYWLHLSCRCCCMHNTPAVQLAALLLYCGTASHTVQCTALLIQSPLMQVLLCVLHSCCTAAPRYNVHHGTKVCATRAHSQLPLFVLFVVVTLGPLRGPANPMRAQGPKPCPSNET
jgi:hypothetical protein